MFAISKSFQHNSINTELHIQPLEESDLVQVAQLQPEGWGSIMPAIDFYTKSNFCFPIKVIKDNKIVGIGTAIIHNDVAWLGHIIVHPENRNQGIGKFITEALIETSFNKSCTTIYLIATDLGEPVYKKTGFEIETEYYFFREIKMANDEPLSQNIIPYTEDLKMQITLLDQKISGEDRLTHLEQYFPNSFIFQEDNIVQGFYLPTFGEGLIIAGTNSAGIELMKFRLKSKDNAAFPVDNEVALEFMYQNNLKEFRKASRMRLGKKRDWDAAGIYNRIGGNLG